MYKVLAMDAILVKTWTLGQYMTHKIHSPSGLGINIMIKLFYVHTALVAICMS